MNHWPTLPGTNRIDVEALRVNHNGRRFYKHPNMPGELFMNVTRVSGMYGGSEGLSWWQRKQIVERWWDDKDFLEKSAEVLERQFAESDVVDPKEVKKRVTNEAIRISDRVGNQSARAGTAVHDLLEEWVQSDSDGRESIMVSCKGRYAPLLGEKRAESVAKKFQQGVKALSEIHAIPRATEAVAYITSSPVKIAGSIDLIADLAPSSPLYEHLGLPPEKTITLIVDYKSGKGYYDSSALQVSAYMNADEIYGTPERLDLDWAQTLGFVLHLRERSHSWVPVNAEAAWPAFQSCAGVMASEVSNVKMLGVPIFRESK